MDFDIEPQFTKSKNQSDKPIIKLSVLINAGYLVRIQELVSNGF
jgi:hypothetical protein